MKSLGKPFIKFLRGLFIIFSEIFFSYFLIYLYIENFGLKDSEKITKLSLIFFLISWLFFSYIRGRYSLPIKINLYKDILREIKELVLISSVLTITSFSLKISGFNEYFNSKNLPLVLFIIVFCSIVNKLLCILFFDYNFQKQRKNILIFGYEQDLKNIKKVIYDLNYRKNVIFTLVEDYHLLRYLPDEVLISNNYNLSNLHNIQLETFQKNNIQILTTNKWFEQELNCIPVEFLDLSIFLNSTQFSNSREFELRIKRIGDIVFSIILIIFSIPLLFIASLFIWINDKGPLLYKQNRQGIFRKKINITKLRTMVTNAEKNGVQWSANNDKRITNIGKILRKWRIDELPQLLSVLKGDMSLIGPRPEREEFNNILNKEINYYNLRTFIKPGLSGWAQVNYSYTASINDSKNKLGYDLFYICNYSIFLDILILFKTIKLILNGKGSTPNVR